MSSDDAGTAAVVDTSVAGVDVVTGTDTRMRWINRILSIYAPMKMTERYKPVWALTIDAWFRFHAPTHVHRQPIRLCSADFNTMQHAWNKFHLQIELSCTIDFICLLIRLLCFTKFEHARRILLCNYSALGEYPPTMGITQSPKREDNHSQKLGHIRFCGRNSDPSSEGAYSANIGIHW